MVRHKGGVARSLLFGLVSFALLGGPSFAATADKKTNSVSNLIIKRKYQSAASALTQLANKNDRNAQYKLGVMYRLGLGVPRDEERALFWIGKAAAGGHAKAASLIKQLAFKPDPTIKKSGGGAGAATPAVTGINYAKLPPRQKGQADWLTFAAARNNGEAVSALLPGEAQASESALRAAVAANGFKAIEAMFASTQVDANDKLMLREAIDRGLAPALALLLQKWPAFVKQLSADKEALKAAVTKCNPDVNATLAQSGTLDQVGPDLFVVAARNCSVPVSDRLWSNLTDVNAADGSGRTALWYAAARGDDMTAKLLLDAGAAPDAADHDGLTPLHAAAANGHATTLELLLQKAAQLPPAADGTTVLMSAAYSGCEACVTLVADKTSDIDAKNGNGNTALLLAVLNKREAIARLLVSRGANTNARNVGSDTPQKVAERLGMTLNSQ